MKHRMLEGTLWKNSTMFYASIVLSFIVISLPSISYGSDPTNISNLNQCVTYKADVNLIQIFCESAYLTDVAKQLNDTSILGRENQISVKNDSNGDRLNNTDNSNKIWILNAGIEIEKGAALIIDSSDTSWLKMVATPTLQLKPNMTQNITTDQTSDSDDNTVVVSKNNRNNPNGIHVRGSLKIDGVRVTSWDPETNDVVKFKIGKRTGEEHTKTDYDTAEPRPFIRVSSQATGTTNITNSEIAYLGYSCSRCSGISYYGGERSVIKGNNIHHLLKGFYSKGMGEMTIEGNQFHDNHLYGIDPHTGSHDIVIRKNIVYNNNASGIICSKDCHHLLIEDNEVYSNTGAGRGISFSINTTNSVARNNNVYEHPRCIGFNRESNFNQVYNNTISNCKTGVYVSDTTNNLIRGNKIVNVSSGIVLKDINNQIEDNNISGTKSGIVFIREPNSNITNSKNATETYSQDKNDQSEIALGEMTDINHISETEKPSVIKTTKVNDTEPENLDNTTLDAGELS